MVGDHFAAVGFQVVGQRIIYREALFGQLNRRANHFVERHCAVFFQREGEPGDGARRAGSQMRGQRFLAVRVALIVEKHIPGGLFRGHLAEVDRRGITVFGPQHHKPAAADITGLRMGDRQRVAHRHGGIDRVAALTQNIHAYLRCQRVHRGHHPLLSADRVKYIFLYAIRYRRRGGICRNGKTAARQQRSDDHLTPERCFYHCHTPE